MSSYFARSINKAPAYLSPCRRPTIGRTLSNSSDLSLTSNCSGRSEDVGETVTSAPGTPTLEALDQRHQSSKQRPDSPALLSPRAGTTRPVAIEIPKIRKHSSSSCNTPDDEPISARGDLPGGYFPLHEDKARVHRHHPFQQQLDPRNPANKDNVTMRSSYQGSSHVPTSSSVYASATVSSYLPSGFPDHPLPVGKYYPSNYEQRNSHLKQQHNYVSESMMSYSRSHDPSASRFSPGGDSRQRLQQYQRDMAAQAAMALDGSTRGGSRHNVKGLALPDIRYMPNTPPKPLAPRLIPLGSPGPVTPMELETKDGEYLNKGKGPSMLSKENLAPPGAGYTAHSL